MRIGKALAAANNVSDHIPGGAYDTSADIINMFMRLVQDNGVLIEDAKELVKYKFQTEAVQGQTKSLLKNYLSGTQLS